MPGGDTGRCAGACERDQLMQGLSIDSIAGAVNVGRALRMVTKGTVPSDDGFPTEFYAKGELRGTMVPHLGRLFNTAYSGR